MFDSVNVLDVENVIDSVNVSVGIREQTSSVVILMIFNVPNLSPWYDDKVRTVA